MADSAAAIENMMIAATSLGIGPCWVNQLKWLNNNEPICDYMSELGIPKDEVIYGAILLGYSKQRNGNPVIFVK